MASNQPGDSEGLDHRPVATDGGTTSDRTRDNAVVVGPGADLRTALDEVTEGLGAADWKEPYGQVRLEAGKTYELTETLELPEGSTLDCNGARLEVRGDFDAIRCGRASFVDRPFVDARGVDGYDSTLLTITDTIGGGKVGPYNPCTIRDMQLAASPGEGTGVLLEDVGENGHWGTRVSGMVWGADTSIHLHATEEGSWINSCRFNGVVTQAGTAITTEASNGGDVLCNEFNIAFQPNPDIASEWFWDLRAGGRQSRNVAFATAWDAYLMPEPTVWHLGDAVGTHRRECVRGHERGAVLLGRARRLRSRRRERRQQERPLQLGASDDRMNRIGGRYRDTQPPLLCSTSTTYITIASYSVHDGIHQ